MSISRLGFYLCILGLVAAATSCRANGQNCQVHWDCCSRKCMTYLSVCAKKIARAFSRAVLPQSNSTQKNDAKQSAHQFPDKKSVRTPQEE